MIEHGEDWKRSGPWILWPGEECKAGAIHVGGTNIRRAMVRSSWWIGILEIVIQSSKTSLLPLLRLYHLPARPHKWKTTTTISSQSASNLVHPRLRCNNEQSRASMPETYNSEPHPKGINHHCGDQAENSSKREKSHEDSGKIEKLSSRKKVPSNSGPCSMDSSFPACHSCLHSNTVGDALVGTTSVVFFWCFLFVFGTDRRTEQVNGKENPEESNTSDETMRFR